MGEDGKRVNGMSVILAGAFLGLFSGAVGAAIIHMSGERLGLMDAPNERSSHQRPTPRGGGAGFVPGFAIAALAARDLVALPAGVLIGLLGFVEDRFSLSSRLRLFLQFSISVSAVFLLYGAPSSGAGLLFFILWTVFITGTTNFYNFMDGINGMAGIAGATAFCALAFFSYFMAGSIASAGLCVFLAFACLGFLPFNLPRARVFLGDAGSMLLGFEFAFFVARCSVSIEAFLCVAMFLCLFYADCLMTLYIRWQSNEPLMKAHRRHLYQYLSNDLGLKHWKVSALYGLIQAAVAVLSLAAYARGLLWQLALIGVFCVLFIVSYRLVKVLGARVVENRGGLLKRAA